MLWEANAIRAEVHQAAAKNLSFSLRSLQLKVQVLDWSVVPVVVQDPDWEASGLPDPQGFFSNIVGWELRVVLAPSVKPSKGMRAPAYVLEVNYTLPEESQKYLSRAWNIEFEANADGLGSGSESTKESTISWRSRVAMSHAAPLGRVTMALRRSSVTPVGLSQLRWQLREELPEVEDTRILVVRAEGKAPRTRTAVWYTVGELHNIFGRLDIAAGHFQPSEV